MTSLDDAPPDPTATGRPGWRCPGCDAERVAEDAFCGRCGAPRPAASDGPGADADAGPRRRVTWRRTLVLNGALVAAVVLVVLFARGEGPSSIAFEPGTWRCDGTERAWVATVPASAIDVRTEWRLGGPEGEIRATATTPRVALDAYATGMGSIRYTTTASDAPECGLEPGTWTMALRDADSNTLLAHGEVVLAAP